MRPPRDVMRTIFVSRIRDAPNQSRHSCESDPAKLESSVYRHGAPCKCAAAGRVWDAGERCSAKSRMAASLQRDRRQRVELRHTRHRQLAARSHRSSYGLYYRHCVRLPSDLSAPDGMTPRPPPSDFSYDPDLERTVAMCGMPDPRMHRDPDQVHRPCLPPLPNPLRFRPDAVQDGSCSCCLP